MASDNNNSSLLSDPLGRTKLRVGFEVFFAVVICLASIFGNLFVVLVVNRESQLKNITNIFIHNLAWTDICMAALHMPFWIISLYNGRWIFTKELCQLDATMLYTFLGASLNNIIVVAVNRYLKVVKPNIYRRFFPSKRIARLYCLATWFVAVLISTPPLYGWGKFGYHPRSSLCNLAMQIEHSSYDIVLTGISSSGVTFLLFYCYYKIYRTVKASSTNLSSHTAHDNVPNTSSNNTSRTDVKLLKMTFIVICVYMICWVPASLVVLCEIIFLDPPRLVNAVVIYMLFCSSAANPIIYSVMNPQFKRAYARILRCKTNTDEHGQQTSRSRNVQLEMSTSAS